MFGAEHLLMRRCKDKETFEKTVKLINDFKDYFIRHNQVIYENPSPGNKAGGITTLEEKSLGCVQKGGKATVVDVLTYGDTVTESGLSLLNGPGNDIVDNQSYGGRSKFDFVYDRQRNACGNICSDNKNINEQTAF